MTVLLAITYSFMARAAYVPSTARRTLLLSLALGVPLVVGTYVAYLARGRDVLARDRHDRLAGGPPTQLAGRLATSIAVWWSLTTVLATAISSVIYGLRREVREARKLGQYTLEEKLGEGGMGVVYRASHAMLRRPTAVKLLPADKAGEQSIAALRARGPAHRRLSHPNTVTIFDFGRTPGGRLLLRDGAPGRGRRSTCWSELDGAQPPERALHVLDGVAGALAEAHEIGLIHRDVKPANIILCKQGGLYDVPKVVDFGLVKDLERRRGRPDGHRHPHRHAALHGPRSDPDPGRPGRAQRSLRARRGRLLPGHGHARLPGPERDRGLRPSPPHHARAALRAPGPGGSGGPRKAAARLPGEGPGPSGRRRRTKLQQRVRECRAYGAWDRERARRWWQEHGEKLRRHRTERPDLDPHRARAVVHSSLFTHRR